MSPIDWLDILKVDKSKIEKQEKLDRSVYKTALYSVINTIDWVNLSQDEKLNILLNSKTVEVTSSPASIVDGALMALDTDTFSAYTNG